MLTYDYQLGEHVLSMTSDWCKIGQAILYYDRFMSHKGYENIQAIDEDQQTYTLKQLKKQQKSDQAVIHDLALYFDASFDQSTTLSGLGIVIMYRLGHETIKKRKNLQTSDVNNINEAEYFSLFHGLDQLRQLNIPPQDIHIYGDSLVVINQLNGEWPVLDIQLTQWADDVEVLLKELRLTPNYHHIDRKDNKQADRLAEQALLGISIDSFHE